MNSHLPTLASRRYNKAIETLRGRQLAVRGVRTDAEGVVPTALNDAIVAVRSRGGRVAFIYIVPTYNNPRGTSYGVERLLDVLAVCAQHDVLAVADDPCVVCLVALRTSLLRRSRFALRLTASFARRARAGVPPSFLPPGTVFFRTPLGRSAPVASKPPSTSPSSASPRARARARRRRGRRRRAGSKRSQFQRRARASPLSVRSPSSSVPVCARDGSKRRRRRSQSRCRATACCAAAAASRNSRRAS